MVARLSATEVVHRPVLWFKWWTRTSCEKFDEQTPFARAATIRLPVTGRMSSICEQNKKIPESSEKCPKVMPKHVTQLKRRRVAKSSRRLAEEPHQKVQLPCRALAVDIFAGRNIIHPPHQPCDTDPCVAIFSASDRNIRHSNHVGPQLVGGLA